MPFTNDDLLAIKAELTNDPLNIDLDTNPAHDEDNANALNLVRSTITVKKRSLATSRLFNAVDPIEYQALSPQQQAWFDALLRLGQIDPFSDTGIMDGLDDCFSAESDSRASILAESQETGSRITQLFQAGTLSRDDNVTPSDIANARAAV
jgi:hypothetical protein